MIQQLELKFELIRPDAFDEGPALAGKPRQDCLSNRLQRGFKPLRLTLDILVYFVSKPMQFIPFGSLVSSPKSFCASTATARRAREDKITSP